MKFFVNYELSHKTIASFFILKIIAGITLWWVFTNYYTSGDFISYFDTGNVLYDIFWKDPNQFFKILVNEEFVPELADLNPRFEKIIYNDSRTMMFVNFIYRFFSFGYFHVHTIFMCFLSLLGSIALFKTFIPYFKDKKNLLVIAIFFAPSVLFWTSGVMKEGVLFFGIGMLLYITKCGLEKNYTWIKIVAVVFFISLLLLIKFYVLIALLPGLILNIFVSRSSEKKILFKYFSILILLLIFAESFKLINPDFNLLKIIADKQAKSISFAKGGVFLYNKKHFVCIDFDKKETQLVQISFKNDTRHNQYRIKKGSSYLQWNQNNMSDTTYIEQSVDTSLFSIDYMIKPANLVLQIKRLNPTDFSFLTAAPSAIFNVFAFPFIFQVKSVFQVISALENLFIILLLICAFIFLDKKIEHKAVLLFCTSFVLILFVLVGFTTPVIGSIVRYKTPAMPFLLMVILLLIDTKKLLNKFTSLSKLVFKN